jgi:glycosyltransferase involved in cell wall biosynthesis
MNKRIAILLPYKEDYNKNSAGSASLWVKDFFENSKLKKVTTIYGINTKKKSLSKNFVNLNNKFPLFTFKKNIYYTKLFLQNIHKQTQIIEIHNRPEIFHFINQNKPQYKLILVFHNNPLLIRGSKRVKEREEILKKCSAIIFISKWVQKMFFQGMNKNKRKNCFVIYHAIKKIKIFPKKKKIICFIGKLNKSKGYDLAGKAIIKILNMHKDWKAIVAGSEKREVYNFNHKRLKIYNWLNHKKILILLKKSSICLVPSVWDEPFGRIAMEASNYGNAVILSNKGGLLETTNHYIKLAQINDDNIFKQINKLLIDQKKLLRIQKNSFYDYKHYIEKSAQIFDKIKLKNIKD